MSGIVVGVGNSLYKKQHFRVCRVFAVFVGFKVSGRSFRISKHKRTQRNSYLSFSDALNWADPDKLNGKKSILPSVMMLNLSKRS